MATFAVVLGAIALTLWATIAADVIKGPIGWLAAAVLTVSAGVAVNSVFGIRDFLLRGRTELERLEAEEAADREALRRGGELPGESPAGLLEPRRGLVGFTGRESELAGLLAWCDDEWPRGAAGNWSGRGG